MQRTVTFRTDREFTLAWTAYLGARRPDSENFVSVRADGRIQAALQSVSVPVLSIPGPDGQPTKPPRGLDRTLRAAPATMTLGGDDFDRLVSFFETTRWMPETRLEAAELRDWIAASPATAAKKKR